jgi:hypothetical protein
MYVYIHVCMYVCEYIYKQRIIGQLHKLLGPFTLRRLKVDIIYRLLFISTARNTYILICEKIDTIILQQKITVPISCAFCLLH